MFSHTVLLPADVRRIAKNAEAAGLNQQVTSLAVRKLDPDGFSIMSIEIPFHNDEDHHRVTAFLRIKDQQEPAVVLMDVLADDWDKLPEAVTPGVALGGTEANYVTKTELRKLTQKWIARANHPQYTKRPDVRDTMLKCVEDLQKLVRETR